MSGAQIRKLGDMMKNLSRVGVASAAAIVVLAAVFMAACSKESQSQADRGKYLVTIGGCNDCHTPGYFFGKPDMARFLGGSDVGFEIPGLGAFAGRNITPDKETGIGNWTDEQITAALTTGQRPDGRHLAPIMPYASFSHLSKEDVAAMVAYLRSVPAVNNKVAGPFKPGDNVSIFTFRILPPGATAAPAPK
jgi:mono/diheme cytochrome c family protein